MEQNVKIDIEWDTENKCWAGIMKFDDGFIEILASDIDQLAKDVWSSHEDYLAKRGNLIIENLRNIGDGWYFGSGLQPSDNTINVAKNIQEVLQLENFSAHPGEKGEVELIGNFQGQTIDIIIEGNKNDEVE